MNFIPNNTRNKAPVKSLKNIINVNYSNIINDGLPLKPKGGDILRSKAFDKKNY